MKKRIVLTSMVLAMSLAITCHAGCSGGGSAVAPPVDNNHHTYSGDSINPLTTWVQEYFQVPAEGGTFEFNGGRMIIPSGAVKVPRVLSVAKSQTIEGRYVFQPEAYVFQKPITIEFDSANVYSGEGPYIAVYRYRPADISIANSFEGFITEPVQNIVAVDGKFSFVTEEFGTFAYLLGTNDFFHIAFSIPPNHMPYGAVAVKSTRNFFGPGQMAMVDMSGHLVGATPYANNLSEWTSIDHFNAPSTYLGAYLLPEEPTGNSAGFRHATTAAGQLDYKVSSYGAPNPGPTYRRVFTDDHMLVTGNLIADSYQAAGVSIGGWVRDPMGWMKHGKQEDTVYLKVGDPDFDVEVAYVYCDASQKTWRSLPATIEQNGTSFAYLGSQADTLVLHVYPSNAVKGTYSMRFGGVAPAGIYYRSDFLTFIVSDETEPAPISVSVPARASTSEYVFALVSPVQYSGLNRTQLTYNNFSLDIDGLSKSDFNVFTGPRNAVWPEMDVAFVIDATDSMYYDLYDLRYSLPGFIEKIKAPGINLMLGGVVYRTSVDNERDFTSDSDQFISDINAINANGGEYYSRNTLDAIAAAVNDLHWRDGAVREIIVFTDGKMCVPNDGTAFAQHNAYQIGLLLQAHGIVLNAFLENYYTPNIGDVATQSGGKVLDVYYDDLSDLSLVTASYALWWDDPDPGIDLPHFVLLSVYNSVEDKANNKPWRTAFGTFKF